jgi:hypothetical protein
MSRNLLLLGCSATKLDCAGELTAIQRYDGPTYRVVRSFLRDYSWPANLSIAILSAKHGVIGSLTAIKDYDVRMTSPRAERMSAKVTNDLRSLMPSHGKVNLVMGRDYLQSINFDALGDDRHAFHFTEGGIGSKLGQLHELLRTFPSEKRRVREAPRLGRPLYFLPDWDDFVDQDFDFEKDKFSTLRRNGRREIHLSALMRPRRICDGVLVSLAQHLGSKGVLKRFSTLADAIAPRSVRAHFALENDQLAFGDCGAFSYVNEDKPTISVEQAVALYDLYDFDFGASVDHIPAARIIRDGKPHLLTLAERKRRMKLTRENAADFILTHRLRSAHFTPVGVIQGIFPSEYSESALEYCEMGYDHLALGGLVPKSNSEIKEIVEAVSIALKSASLKPWIHLLGIYRPALQELFKKHRISSFDSASYFRKAWLRSDQNYIGAHGSWYAAIRVPPSSDPRSLKRLQESGASTTKIRRLEKAALLSLHQYAAREISIDVCLRNVVRYDELLQRAEDYETSVRQYRRTLEERPWERCGCTVCSTIGIDTLIFRGLNRNKRRGAHNTLQLFNSICTSAAVGAAGIAPIHSLAPM